jgi:hypothetical protein
LEFGDLYRGVFVSRPKQDKVKSNAERSRDKRQRQKFGLYCQATRYSAGTARDITARVYPEARWPRVGDKCQARHRTIRGKLIYSGLVNASFLETKARTNEHGSRLDGMPAEQGFDYVDHD